MPPFVKVIQPAEHTDFEFWVVVFRPNESPEVHSVGSQAEAEALAEELAGQNQCQWSHQLPLRTWWNSHWWDEDGNLRELNRVEFVRLANGAIQFTVFSDSHRISTEIGRGADLPGFLLDVSLLMGGFDEDEDS